ncbi:uncharacterized protein LOC128317717 [Pangasianodon hypophthalmus]|uniref:uncharacterized protein LOC128317717 n=1 Tax=Pangasianodon hypophthalmus TaxID=310915 RepID=UPI002307E835|nr:uncharacterized protein LOC128317717 [Pangasianodon hypophthalmus]
MEVSMMRYMWAALCITVLVMSDSLNGMSLGKSRGNDETTGPSFKYKLSMDITNRIYNNSLLNSGSPDYEILFAQVKGAFYSVYGCSTCDTHTFYQGVSAMTFSNQTGTVLVNATLVFQSNQINALVIKNLLIKAITGSNEINGLIINSEFTQGTSRSTPTATSPTTTTTTTATTRSTTNTHPSKTTTTSPNTRPTTHLTTTTTPTPITRPTTTTTHPNTTTTIRPTTTTTRTTTTHPTTTTTHRPTTTTTTTTTSPTTPTTTTRPTTTTTTSPTTTTTTTTTRPTTTTTTSPTTTTTTTTTRPTTTTTTRPTTTTTTTTTRHHNAASSFFHQSPITLTSFLRFSVSFCLFFLISYSF